ncbi:MAG: hypothetical protein QW789_03540 [Nitrososphaerota archaeon]|uniref:Uncharacterized protein n=1 Tax=Fervidobacterium pennivorans TaxID=93466 RepID=A0A7V4CP96_FERPE
MPKLVVKSREETSAKWVEETPRRSTYYQRYTAAAAGQWEANTLAAATTYKNAISAPDIDRRFVGGVKRAGAAKFARKVTEVGVARFAPGVSAAKTDYESAIAPYLDELAKIDVPPRKPRGDPGNLDRVKAIFEALRKKKLAMLAAGP